MPGGVEHRRHGLGYRPGAERAGPAGPRPARPGRAPIGTALRWGAAGVLMGVAFWICLGIGVPTHGDLQLLRHQGLQDAPAPGCTALALDRDRGHTTAAPCPLPHPTLRDRLTAFLGQPLPP